MSTTKSMVKQVCWQLPNHSLHDAAQHLSSDNMKTCMRKKSGAYTITGYTFLQDITAVTCGLVSCQQHDRRPVHVLTLTELQLIPCNYLQKSKEAANLGRKWQEAILDMCDQHFFFTEVQHQCACWDCA